MKRLFDLICSIIGLVILSPIFLMICILIILTMGWPIFYTQERVGRNGISFRIFKFRSMVKDAERRGLAVTTGGDPRVTAIGKILRKTKLDELPQLVNVAIGDMSLVGPRPEVPKYVAMYSDTQRKVLTVRPGLTDPASIAYRDEEKVLARYEDTEKAYIEVLRPAKLTLNLAYIEKQSLCGDIALIWKTIWAIISRR